VRCRTQLGDCRTGESGDTIGQACARRRWFVRSRSTPGKSMTAAIRGANPRTVRHLIRFKVQEDFT